MRSPRRWHPLTLGGMLLAAALATAGLGWSWGCWLAAGATAGFATSGST